MKKRMEEYNSLEKSDYRTFERLIFILHEWSSNHSQNWLLALFWILSITFLYSYITNDFTYYQNDFNFINEILEMDYTKACILIINLILISYLLYLKLEKEEQISHSIIFFLLVNFYIFYTYLTNDSYLKYFSNSLNPFSIMTGCEKITFLGLIYKTAIAYLIYQLIVSIRQNTRRK